MNKFMLLLSLSFSWQVFSQTCYDYYKKSVANQHLCMFTRYGRECNSRYSEMTDIKIFTRAAQPILDYKYFLNKLNEKVINNEGLELHAGKLKSKSLADYMKSQHSDFRISYELDAFPVSWNEFFLSKNAWPDLIKEIDDLFHGYYLEWIEIHKHFIDMSEFENLKEFLNLAEIIKSIESLEKNNCDKLVANYDQQLTTKALAKEIIIQYFDDLRAENKIDQRRAETRLDFSTGEKTSRERFVEKVIKTFSASPYKKTGFEVREKSSLKDFYIRREVTFASYKLAVRIPKDNNDYYDEYHVYLYKQGTRNPINSCSAKKSNQSRVLDCIKKLIKKAFEPRK